MDSKRVKQLAISQRLWLEDVHKRLKRNWFQEIFFNFRDLERCLSFVEERNIEILEMLKDVKANDRPEPKPITQEELEELKNRFTLSDS